jgi:hypothetical protein
VAPQEPSPTPTHWGGKLQDAMSLTGKIFYVLSYFLLVL